MITGDCKQYQWGTLIPVLVLLGHNLYANKISHRVPKTDQYTNCRNGCVFLWSQMSKELGNR